MGWRYRKRINILPGIHLNISKSGISTNVGVKGASVTFGPKGTYHALESTIVADRHIHMSASDLIDFNQAKGNIVKVRFENGVELDQVHIKSDETCVLEMHMNKDEAISLGIETGMEVKIC